MDGGGEEGDAQLVSRREDGRVDLRERSAVLEHGRITGESGDGANAFGSCDWREGHGLHGIILQRNVCLKRSEVPASIGKSQDKSCAPNWQNRPPAVLYLAHLHDLRL